MAFLDSFIAEQRASIDRLALERRRQALIGRRDSAFLHSCDHRLRRDVREVWKVVAKYAATKVGDRS